MEPSSSSSNLSSTKSTKIAANNSHYAFATKFGNDPTLPKFGADLKFVDDSQFDDNSQFLDVGAERQWEEDEDQRSQIFGNSELSNDRIKVMQLAYRREEQQLDSQIKSAHAGTSKIRIYSSFQSLGKHNSICHLLVKRLV